MELQSEVHTWGSSSNEPFPHSASFLTDGNVTCGMWTLACGNEPTLREGISSLQEPAVLLSHSFLPLVSY